MRRVRVLPTFLAAVATLLTAAAPAAHAETFVVSTCGASSLKGTGAWTYTALPGAPVETGDLCGSPAAAAVGSFNRSATHAFWAATGGTPPAAAPGRVAGFTLNASPGATITRVSLDRRLAARSADWEMRLTAAAGTSPATTLESCVGPTTATCADGAVAATGSFSQQLDAGTTTVDLAAWCIAAVSCAYVGGAQPTFAGAIASGTIEVSESTPPTATAPSLGSARGGKASPEDTLTFAGSDPLGLRTLELLQNDRPIATLYGSCVDWGMRPCADGPAGSPGLARTATLDDLDIGDGFHTLRTRATDAAGNVSVSDPVNVTVEYPAIIAQNLAGGGPSNEPYRTLTWSVGGARAVAFANVELCTVGRPGDCRQFKVEPEGPFTFPSGEFPSVTATVLLIDEDGGVGRSEATTFTHDITPPKPPALALVGSNGLTRIVQIAPDAGDADITRLRPRLCTHSENACTALPETGPTDRIVVALPGAGSQRFEVELLDAAGNVSRPGQLALLHTDPSGSAPGKPDAPGATITGKPIALVPKLPKKLGKGSSVLIRGKVNAGSATKITVTLSGRSAKRKAVKTVKSVKPKKNGTFSVRVKVPKKLNRKKGVLVTVAVAPGKGWLATKQRKRLR